MKIAVIGAGNGGQALAAHMAYMGHEISLYDRDVEKIAFFKENKTISLTGALNLEGAIQEATTDIKKAINDADLIMVATTATAHSPVAASIAGVLQPNQIVILNPGRTCGAVEFKNTLLNNGAPENVIVAEAQTLVYACRIIKDGLVNIIGVKDRVLISAYPAGDTQKVLDIISPLYPCFYAAKNVLQTSFENIGAVFHPAVVLFNAAAIERGSDFYFYRDMTDGLARIINQIDNERLAVAKAYGISPLSAFDWVSYAYDGVEGKTLCERMHNNPAYYEILAPKTINCRQITEDIPTGILPISELGHAAGVPTPMLDSLIEMCSTLMEMDYREEGRTLKGLGLEGLSKQQIIKKIS